MTGLSDEPVMEQRIIASSGGVVHAVQNGDQYVYLYRHRPPYRVEPFPAEPQPVPDPVVRRAPSWLLAPRHQVVPFYGRDDDLARLRDWRDYPAPGVSVRLLHAAGGQGKTRLAAEFGTTSLRAGWTVAVARHLSEAAAAGGGGDQQLAVHQHGLLIIVDYAERWPLNDMVTLLRQHQAAAATSIRVLLVARPGGGWWQSLVYQLSKINIVDAGEWELQPLAARTRDRQAIYVAARDRFADVLGLSAATATTGPDLSGSQFELVLALHMKALVDVDAASRGVRPPPGRDQSGLSSYLLDREHDYWQAAHHHGEGPIRTSELAMGRAVYTATLTHALTHRDGVNALIRAKIGEATAQPVSQVLTDHAILYPPDDPGTCLEPLYPDRLGEDFTALTTPGHTGTGHTGAPWATTLPAQLLVGEGAGCAPAYTRMAISVLVEASVRWPHLAEGQLYPLLRGHPDLALAADGATLARLADLQHPGILSVLEALEPLLPSGLHIDLDTAAAAIVSRLTEQRLARTTDPAQRAGLLTTLGNRLENARQYQQALAAGQEAVDLYRRLAETNPATYLPDLAGSLSNLGIRLLRLGLHENARQYQQALAAGQEAVDLYRRLAETNPATYLPGLAGSLGNLDILLSEAGRREDALAPSQESVDLYRRLAEADPAAYRSNFATSLSNLSGLLSMLGRREDALLPRKEAVTIHRRLAEAEPAGYIPGLAMSLSDFGILLSQLGRRRQGLAANQEAVDLYRRLAETNPATHLTGLAMSLSDRSSLLSQLGWWGDALAPSQEAANLYRRAAETDPAYLPGLAASLSNLSNSLSKAGLREDALAPSQESADLYRRLSETNPATHLPDLAELLSDLGVLLSQLQRWEEAQAPAEEAVTICRGLAEANPAAYRAGLARGLWAFGRVRAAGLGQGIHVLRRRLPPRAGSAALSEALAGKHSPAVVPVAERDDLVGRFGSVATRRDLWVRA